QSKTISVGNSVSLILISGIIFVLLIVFGIRDLIVKAIPLTIKTSISAAIGFFITYLVFRNSEIVLLEDAITSRNFTDPNVFLAILGLILTAIMTLYRLPGALLIGIIAIKIIGIPFGITRVPEQLFGVAEMSELSQLTLSFDFNNLLNGSTM